MLKLCVDLARKEAPLMSRSLRLAFFCLVGFCLPRVALAVTRTVPTQFPTIQAALNASANGDTVAVLPGTYVENLLIERAIVLRSTGGPAVTVIDGSNPPNPNEGSAVKMFAGEITGFEIRNGSGHISFQHPYPRVGGGVYVYLFEGSAKVEGNWIHDNVITGDRADGGGVWAFGNVAIRNNRIYRNRVEATTLGSGAGIKASAFHTDNPGIVVEGNEVFANHVEHGSGAVNGTGVFRHNIVACNSVLRSVAFPNNPSSGVRWGPDIVEGNTIIANWSFDLDQYAAALQINAPRCSAPNPPCPVEVFGNVVARNSGNGVECRIVQAGGEVNFACNDFWGNTGDEFIGEDCSNPIGQNGNISVDPQFGTGDCPYVHGNFCLETESPLLPENSPPGCGLIGALGECSQIGIADAPPSSELRVGPATPNPFADRTTIPFYLAKESAVEIAIVDVVGRQIRKIAPGRMATGDHTAQWDGRTDEGTRAASGAYIAVIRAGGDKITETLLLLR
jgi:hypothetical protein